MLEATEAALDFLLGSVDVRCGDVLAVELEHISQLSLVAAALEMYAAISISWEVCW
jgi:hypothetical protein